MPWLWVLLEGMAWVNDHLLQEGLMRCK